MESNDMVDDEESHTHACERVCCYCCRHSGHLVTKSNRADRQIYLLFEYFFFSLNLCENQFSVGFVLCEPSIRLDARMIEVRTLRTFTVCCYFWFLLRAMLMTIFHDFGMRSRMRDTGDMWECELGLSFRFLFTFFGPRKNPIMTTRVSCLFISSLTSKCNWKL